MDRVIDISLDNIERAIKAIDDYKRELPQKVNEFRKRLGDELASMAQSGFNSAMIDDLTRGGGRTPNVTVSADDDGKICIVVANGEDAVWCEFGAGVYHNGSVGSSPHPQGASLGYTIGSYGKGYGKGKAWGYVENGVLNITRGSPASMPMYNAMKEIIAKADTIAREVWK